MNRALRRTAQKLAATRARSWPARLVAVPRDEWPVVPTQSGAQRRELWKSRDFIVQLFDEGHGTQRLTVSRTAIADDGDWLAEITWDEMQRVKREIGFGEMWAVEVFPPDSEVVNVASMRHLWLLLDPPTYGWKKAQIRKQPPPSPADDQATPQGGSNERR